MGGVHRLPTPQVSFSLQTAGRLMTKIFPQWGCWLKASKPCGRRSVARLAAGRDCAATLFQKTLQRRAAACTQALMALADTAMVLACSAAWNGYRPMTSIDQTTHFLQPVNFDVIADARAVRLGRNASFGRGKHLRGAVRERIPRSE